MLYYSSTGRLALVYLLVIFSLPSLSLVYRHFDAKREFSKTLVLDAASGLLTAIDTDPPRPNSLTDTLEKDIGQYVAHAPDQHPDCTFAQPRLHALTIGINRYASNNINNLWGAVSDANAVDDFLVHTLCVPKDQIVSLRDQDATHNTILGKLGDFNKDVAIQKNDPIVIYFSGHGLVQSKGLGTTPTSMLATYDSFTAETDSPEVQAINSSTFGEALDALAESKGNNIVVIIDACHSGFGTRQFHQFFTGVLSECGSASHVLLTACGQGETAREVCGTDGQCSLKRGTFTKALLDRLRSHQLNITTYYDLIENVRRDMSRGVGQTPQLEGLHMDRLLFTARTKAPDSLSAALYENKYTKTDGFNCGVLLHYDQRHNLPITTEPFPKGLAYELRLAKRDTSVASISSRSLDIYKHEMQALTAISSRVTVEAFSLPRNANINVFRQELNGSTVLIPADGTISGVLLKNELGYILYVEVDSSVKISESVHQSTYRRTVALPPRALLLIWCQSPEVLKGHVGNVRFRISNKSMDPSLSQDTGVIDRRRVQEEEEVLFHDEINVVVSLGSSADFSDSHLEVFETSPPSPSR